MSQIDVSSLKAYGVLAPAGDAASISKLTTYTVLAPAGDAASVSSLRVYVIEDGNFVPVTPPTSSGREISRTPSRIENRCGCRI